MSVCAQSCLTLCNPIDCSPPGSSVHGNSPGKNTGMGCPFFLGIFPTRERNSCISCIGRWILHHHATWEAHVLKQVRGDLSKGRAVWVEIKEDLVLLRHLPTHHMQGHFLRASFPALVWILLHIKVLKRDHFWAFISLEVLAATTFHPCNRFH